MSDNAQDSWQEEFPTPEIQHAEETRQSSEASPRRKRRQKQEANRISLESIQLQEMIEKLKVAMVDVHNKEFDFDDAPALASLALLARENLIQHGEISLKSKEAKFEAKIKESEASARYRGQKKDASSSAAVRLTDAAIKELIPSDEQYRAAQKAAFEAEVDYEKYENILDFLKDAHVFFRNLKPF